MILVIILQLILLFRNAKTFHLYSQTSFRSCVTMKVAPFKEPNPRNVQGNLFVDKSCIDCDACRWICPTVYSRRGLQTVVSHQPESDDEKLKAYSAMIACPVGSIRTVKSDPFVKKAQEAFPVEIDPVHIPGVYHCGYHSAASFGATSYFIKGPNGKNIMIDSPRFNTKLAFYYQFVYSKLLKINYLLHRLAKIIEHNLGGLHTMILTHMDDVADHRKWKSYFPNLERIIHIVDVRKDSNDIEVQLEDFGTWFPMPNITIIHTPGHTAGSLSVRFDTGKEAVMFTGDHVAYNAETRRLEGFSEFNHGNIDVQKESLKKFIEPMPSLDFQWILPGHGRMIRYNTFAAKNNALKKLVNSFADEENEDLSRMFKIKH